MRLVILKNEDDDSHLNWMSACISLGFEYTLLELTSSDWLNNLVALDPGLCLAVPPGRQNLLKQMYDEKVSIIEKYMGIPVFPTYSEISLHENKRLLSYFLEANGIPSPATKVFYNQKETVSLSQFLQFPLVAKTNIGASGSGVEIIRDSKQLEKYLQTAFKDGIARKTGPNLVMGDFTRRFEKLLREPGRLMRRLKVYKTVRSERQKGFVIFQAYIPHAFEWRIVRIGESYFGHKKLKQGDKASGTKGVEYCPVPEKLLSHVKGICERFKFRSMAVDLFEDGKGGYLVNEMQCIFGHVQTHICELNGKPGRYLFKEGEWIFEEGLFNSNISFDLRLKDALSFYGLVEND
ncbi:hypothetical protein MASR1M107_28530 [Ignavibacteriales bacterium]